MKKIYLTLLSCFIAIVTMAQTPGFSYQAIILNPDAQILPGADVEAGLLSDSEIAIRFTIENSVGDEYQETHTTKTDAYGMLHLMVGEGTATIGSFTDVVWDGTLKHLEVEIDFTLSGGNYEALDRQRLSYIPQPLSFEDANRINELELAITTVATELTTIELTPGAQGIQGIAGNDGLDGAKGAQGIQGIVGNDGAVGATGNDGIVGATGAKGNDGAVGATGNDGVDGAFSGAGNDGIDGATGAQGIQGIAGNDGTDGIDGVTGTQGIQGIAGNDGADGIDGETGAQGAQGIHGIAGNDGADGIDGAAGAQGIQGIAGNDGAFSGAQGMQGIAGNDGVDGIDGAAGAQGIQGIQGMEGMQGMQGMEGMEGMEGMRGSSGAAGAAGLPGADGAAGAQGIQGIAGNDGADGATGVGALPHGSNVGEMMYWNGSDWLAVTPPVKDSASFMFVGGVPSWVGGTLPPVSCCSTGFVEAIDFIMFTGNGALLNTGVSDITGNIGSDIGDITGFGYPTVFTGDAYNANAVTAHAKLDVFTAYSQIMSEQATNTIHTPSFGGDETLIPGVYDVAGAGSLAGTLTLDALGNPDAVFIIRFSGAYVVSASSTIVLANAAKSCNVYWVAQGAISVGEYSTMKGTLLANNAAVSVAVGCNIEGKLLTTNGEMSFGPGIISTPSCPGN